MELSQIEHIGIACPSLEEAIPYYENVLGLKCYNIEVVEDQKVKTAFFKIGEVKLELIDYGAEEVFRDGTGEDEDDPKVIMIYGEFTAMNKIQQYLESNGYEIMSAKFDRFPNTDLKQLSPDDQAAVEKLLEKIEEDDDVQNVYHNMQQ